MLQIWAILKKELLIEWRLKHTFWGALLYIGCTVFIVFLMARQPDSRVWNALFWIAQLFIVINTVSKSFLQETVERYRYYNTIVSPYKFILAKLMYSSILMFVMTLVSITLFWGIMDITFQHPLQFVLVAILGSQGLALLFTFLSAIAAQAKQNAALMAILGFPLSIPLLLMLDKLSLAAMAPVFQEDWSVLFLVMIGMNGVIVGLAMILFPFLWKE
jgi:heme exporter protein B